MCASLVCCAEIADTRWRWLEQNLADTGLTFDFVRCVPQSKLEKNFRYINLSRLRGAWQAIKIAKLSTTKLLVTHGPTLAAWCALLSRLLGLRIPIVAHSFNFTQLPGQLKRPLFKLAFTRIDRFVVFSNAERWLYSHAFDLPASRFDVIRWGISPPVVDSPETPLEQGDYVCAIGGNARDYRTLVKAAEQMPDIRFVLVVRPESLLGLKVPANCSTYTNLPLEKTMNVLAHSRFMVLPLLNSEVPCGHVTLVAAMHLGKTFVITDSAGVSDYVSDEKNALTVPAGSAASLVTATRRLWGDHELRTRLAHNGLQFARVHCTQERVAGHFRDLLLSGGILDREAL